MPNLRLHIFDENERQQTERTRAGANVRLGDLELMDLKDEREEAAKIQALEKKDALVKLKELIRQHPGIGGDEILKLGGYKDIPEKELRLLQKIKAIKWRKNGYFLCVAKAQ